MYTILQERYFWVW